MGGTRKAYATAFQIGTTPTCIAAKGKLRVFDLLMRQWKYDNSDEYEEFDTISQGQGEFEEVAPKGIFVLFWGLEAFARLV